MLYLLCGAATRCRSDYRTWRPASTESIRCLVHCKEQKALVLLSFSLPLRPEWITTRCERRGRSTDSCSSSRYTQHSFFKKLSNLFVCGRLRAFSIFSAEWHFLVNSSLILLNGARLRVLYVSTWTSSLDMPRCYGWLCPLSTIPPSLTHRRLTCNLFCLRRVV